MKDQITNWEKLITVSMEMNKDTWGNIETSTIAQEDMLVEFDNGYGGKEGAPFTLWTKDFVYFPLIYDGAEWAGLVKRNPPGEPSDHQGGW